MIDQGVIASYIKQMPYSDFLKTPYWTTIAMYKKYKSSYKCCMCVSNTNLSNGNTNLISETDLTNNSNDNTSARTCCSCRCMRK